MRQGLDSPWIECIAQDYYFFPPMYPRETKIIIYKLFRDFSLWESSKQSMEINNSTHICSESHIRL